MKASKTLASAVAAAAVVGAIGLAYAQTPDTTAPATPADTSGQTMQNQGTTSPSMSTESPSPSTSSTTGLQAERPAQADRN